MIPARGGSKGIPGKNIKELAGKPLIGYTCEAALASKKLDRVICSTDSEEIAAVARDYGAEVPFMRPVELASDTANEWAVWQHALDYIKKSDYNNSVDAIVSLPTTAPLRNVIDVEKCLDEYEHSNVDVVITVTKAHRNPYFNMIINDQNGYSSLVISGGKVIRRQDAPDVYDMTTVAYVASSEYVVNSNGLFDGRVRSVEVPIERAIDVDTELDFIIAERILAIKNRDIKR